MKRARRPPRQAPPAPGESLSAGNPARDKGCVPHPTLSSTSLGSAVFRRFRELDGVRLVAEAASLLSVQQAQPAPPGWPSTPRDVRLMPAEWDCEADLALCGTHQFSFVAEGDNGARDGGDSLWPNEIIIVAACNHYVGSGVYQLSVGGGLLVRRAFAFSSQTIKLVHIARGGERQYSEVTPDLFAELVCGLVLAKYSPLCRPLEKRINQLRNDRL